MVDAASRPPHPIVGVDTSSASGTFGAELSVDVEIIKRLTSFTIRPRVRTKKRGWKGWDKVMLWRVKHVVHSLLQGKKGLI